MLANDLITSTVRENRKDLTPNRYLCHPAFIIPVTIRMPRRPGNVEPESLYRNRWPMAIAYNQDMYS